MANINSELPLGMLDENYELNDYDFVLFHLYESCQEYKGYYLKMRRDHPDRLMIFDNSAYEYFVKGEQLNMDAYVQAILELKPDYYILPDVLRNKEKTLEGVRTFIKDYLHNDKYSDTLLFSSMTGFMVPLAVAQGSSSADLVECIQEFNDYGFTAVGIPFHLDFYTEGRYSQDIESEFMEVYGKETKDIRYAMGRVRWLRDHEDILKKFNYVHLLGSHCPLEKVFYADYNSMDTGYPVKCAMVGARLGEETEKPSVIIDDFLSSKIDKKTKELIRTNVNTFKNY